MGKNRLLNASVFAAAAVVIAAVVVAVDALMNAVVALVDAAKTLSPAKFKLAGHMNPTLMIIGVSAAVAAMFENISALLVIPGIKAPVANGAMGVSKGAAIVAPGTTAAPAKPTGAIPGVSSPAWIDVRKGAAIGTAAMPSIGKKTPSAPNAPAVKVSPVTPGISNASIPSAVGVQSAIGIVANVPSNAMAPAGQTLNAAGSGAAMIRSSAEPTCPEVEATFWSLAVEHPMAVAATTLNKLRMDMCFFMTLSPKFSN
jgi:hypothetical protein